MRRVLICFLFLSMAVLLSSGYTIPETNAGVVVPDGIPPMPTFKIEPPPAPTLASPAPETSPDKDTDYMNLMIRHYAKGDMESLAKTTELRNKQIVAYGLDDEPFEVDEFIENFEQYAGFTLDVDYLELMFKCCIEGNTWDGAEAETKRNLKIDTLGLDEKKIAFDDLYELSRIITSEAGSYWLPMEWKLAVGEVVMNRVASPEFPDTIRGVIYAPGQYAGTVYSWYQYFTPQPDCVEAAYRLLIGERILNNPMVVFQSGVPQGSGIHLILNDSIYGNTYLCYSSYPEKYR